jgi:RNA polymerase sigma factor (sigma-70 family)
VSTTSASAADRAAAAFRAYRDGDAPRMAELVEAATPAMWHTARAVGLDPQLAEDAVQAAWALLVEKAESVRDPQGVLAWLMTTTRRCALRSAQRQSRDTPDEDAGADEVEPATVAGAAPTPGPDEMVLRSERQRTLWQHVQQLTPRCRELLRIIAFADRPDYAAISERLGMPVGSIGPTRGRCLATLRRALAADPRWSRA